MVNKKTIIFDIDGTLADIQHRTHFVTGKKKDFDAFNEAMIDDVPNEPIVRLHDALEYFGFQIVYVTGRLERYREVTTNFLRDISRYERLELHLHMRPEDQRLELHLHMRPEDQRYLPDYQVKQEILNYILKSIDKENIIFAVDDRQQVVDMWRSNGITTLQVADGNY